MSKKKRKKVLHMTREEFNKLIEATPNLIKQKLDYFWDGTLPVDAVELANRLDFKVYSMDLPGKYDGILLVDETGRLARGENQRRIAINKNLSREDMRFVVMHELSHYIAHKFLYPDDSVQLALRDRFYDENGNRVVGRRNEIENHMDFMAACLLMPEDEVRNDINQKEKSDELIDFLCEKYNVSSEMAKRRIDEVRVNG